MSRSALAGWDDTASRRAWASARWTPPERVRRLLTPGGVWMVTTPLTGRLPEERHRIGLTPEEVAVATEGWAEGAWYDLEPNGVRCFVLRAGSGH
ncbi:hypothetical protein K4B79_02275 [Streptomyces lincolnensis]|uniref:hypothetical protein n=1 Tax=Streptomyces lincolnensis TaxID=1915 RepID=UPI001E44B097|nr:hypothetical protein [Streptomyces lincolnensis]MCD7437042.1 hypothetical protein [Streptomyces lincolnensis]